MKKILILILLTFASSMCAQKYVLLEINSKWNAGNPAIIAKLQNVKHIKAFLEDQPKSVRDKVRAVPFVTMYKNGKPIGKWTADITFKLFISPEQIQEAIKKSNK
jgi:ribosomal silencing factor RsfS